MVLQGIRASLGEAFRINKDDQVSSIILETYGDCDIVFIQEAAGAFVEGKAGRRIGGHYHMLPPAVVDGKRDQNCLVLLRKLSFKEGSAVEITDEVLERLHRRDPRQKKVYVPGDLAAFTAVSMSGHPFLLASFHGDTNGLASIPVVQVAARSQRWVALFLSRSFRGVNPPCLLTGSVHTRRHVACYGPEACGRGREVPGRRARGGRARA